MSKLFFMAISESIVHPIIFFAVLSDAVLMSLITSISGLVLALITAYFAYKAKTTSEGTHAAVNQRMTEFMAMAEKSFKAEGKLEGRTEEKVIQSIKETAKLEERVLAQTHQSQPTTAPGVSNPVPVAVVNAAGSALKVTETAD